MNKFFCLLTGGHKYADINMIVMHDPITLTYKVKNYCVKCGKIYTFDFPDEIVDGWLLKGLIYRTHAVRPDGDTLIETLKKNIEEQEADNESNDPEH